MKTNAAPAALADAIFALDKPVVLVLQGGRPFAIPAYYSKAAAVLNTVCSYKLPTQDCCSYLYSFFRVSQEAKPFLMPFLESSIRAGEYLSASPMTQGHCLYITSRHLLLVN